MIKIALCFRLATYLTELKIPTHVIGGIEENDNDYEPIPPIRPTEANANDNHTVDADANDKSSTSMMTILTTADNAHADHDVNAEAVDVADDLDDYNFTMKPSQAHTSNDDNITDTDTTDDEDVNTNVELEGGIFQHKKLSLNLER